MCKIFKILLLTILIISISFNLCNAVNEFTANNNSSPSFESNSDITIEDETSSTSTTISTASNASDSSTITNILLIALIVIGILLVLLAIAILIRLGK